MKQIVISGGTGFIGRHLVASLLEEPGYDITVVTRNPERASEFSSRVEPVSWDHRELTRAVDGAHAVINLAGEPIPGIWTVDKRRRILESRVRAGRAIVEATDMAAEKPGVLIQASAVGYYGSRGDEELDEQASRGEGFLAEVSDHWEKASLPAESMGVRRCIIRSGIVLGDDGFLPRMIRSFRFRIGLIMGDGTHWIPWIHIHDEIAAIRFLMENPGCRGIYNLVNPHPIRFRAFAQHIAAYFKGSILVRLPAPLLRALAGEFAGEVLLAGQRVIPRRLADEGFSFRYTDSTDALNSLLGRRQEQNPSTY